MSEITFSEALDALKAEHGTQLETTRDRGRDLMRETLVEAFGLSRGDAGDLLDALERGKGLQWVEPGGVDVAPSAPPPFAQGTLGEPPRNAPLKVPLDGGHWRIGGAG